MKSAIYCRLLSRCFLTFRIVGFGSSVLVLTCLLLLPLRTLAELSPQTFCTFPREFSSDRRQLVGTPNDFVPEPGSADPLAPLAIPRCSELRPP